MTRRDLADRVDALIEGTAALTADVGGEYDGPDRDRLAIMGSLDRARFELSRLRAALEPEPGQ